MFVYWIPCDFLVKSEFLVSFDRVGFKLSETGGGKMFRAPEPVLICYGTSGKNSRTPGHVSPYNIGEIGNKIVHLLIFCMVVDLHKKLLNSSKIHFRFPRWPPKWPTIGDLIIQYLSYIYITNIHI